MSYPNKPVDNSYEIAQEFTLIEHDADHRHELLLQSLHEADEITERYLQSFHDLSSKDLYDSGDYTDEELSTRLAHRHNDWYS